MGNIRLFVCFDSGRDDDLRALFARQCVTPGSLLTVSDWSRVEAFFAGVGRVLGGSGVLVVYGPFNEGGTYTSPSNRDFDAWLKARDGRSGIRDVEAVQALAAQVGLRPIDDVAMPANNRCLVWQQA